MSFVANLLVAAVFLLFLLEVICLPCHYKGRTLLAQNNIRAKKKLCLMYEMSTVTVTSS